MATLSVNLPPLWRHPQKNKPKTLKKNFNLTYKTSGICEGLNSSLAQSADKLWGYKVQQEKWLLRALKGF